MIENKETYAYLAILKAKPEGDFTAYQEQVKAAEIAFRANFTQIALEDKGDKGILLIYHDFNDLVYSLRHSSATTKQEKVWLDFEAKKAEEAVAYMERVQQDISHSAVIHANPNCEGEGGSSAVRVISGTEGLAKFLGCGKTKAFAIIDSGVLKKAGIQYKVGRCWKFNAERLSDFLKQNPEFLR